MPVPYSPLIVRTPSTPKAMTAKVVPAKLTEIGSNEAICAGLNVWYWLAFTAENSAPIPIIEHQRGQQGPHGGSQGAELRPLGTQHP